MIIHVTGIQGSGKSFICSKLPNIKCIDTDDIMYETYDIIKKKNLPQTDNQFYKISDKIVDNFIEKGDVLFVGMTIEIPNPDYKFFIKIEDLDTVYRRLILRELDKIVENKANIIKHIKNEKKPEDIHVSRIAKIGVHVELKYKNFVKMYKEDLKMAKKDGYKPMTQKEIIRFLKNIKK